MTTHYLIIIALLPCLYHLPCTSGAVGVNYGGTGLSTNPVSLMRAVKIMRRKGIKAVKIYSPDPTTLNELKGSVPHCDIPSDYPSFDLSRAVASAIGFRTRPLPDILIHDILRTLDTQLLFHQFSSYLSSEIQKRSRSIVSLNHDINYISLTISTQENQDLNLPPFRQACRS